MWDGLVKHCYRTIVTVLAYPMICTGLRVMPSVRPDECSFRDASKLLF